MEKKLEILFKNFFGKIIVKKISIYNNKKWDSLLHIKLISEIEKKFLVKINFDEYEKLTDYKSILLFLKKFSK